MTKKPLKRRKKANTNNGHREQSNHQGQSGHPEHTTNQENVRLNNRRLPRNDTPEDDDEPKGKKIYSNVYIIGKGDKIDLVGETPRKKHRSPAIREVEDRLKTSGILSGKEFLEFYQQAREAAGPLPAVREPSERAEQKNSKTVEVGKNSQSEKRGKKGDVGSEPGARGKTVGLRVIGGRYKGLRLKYSGDHQVRPMKDRVRESVFNLMGTLAKGRHVLDLFAGTGALAFEALSRGAESATLIEVHFPTARVIRENMDILKAYNPEISQKISLITTDVFFWGRGITGRTGKDSSLPEELPWLVFCSPPYDFYTKRQQEMLDLMATIREAAPLESVFVVEADERFDFDLLQVEIPPKKRRSYPPAEVAVYIKE